MSRSLRYAAVTSLAAAVLTLAACGSSSDSNTTSGGDTGDRTGYGGGGATTAAGAATSAAAGGAATTAASGGGAPAAGPGAVTIKDFSFDPGDLTVAKGTKVTWTNDDSPTHRIKSGDGSFDSEDLKNGATFEHTFDTAGTFDYICGIHPSMKGKITVTG
jgi:plastocyanin